MASDTYSDLVERNRKLESVLEITRLIGAEQDLQTLLPKVCDASRQLVDANYSIFLVDRVSGALTAHVVHNLSPGQTIHVPRTTGIVGHVADSRQPLIVNNPYEDERFCRDVDIDSGYTTRNILSVPMTNLSGECVGVLQATNRHEGDFTTADLELLSVLCGQVAVAIENAILHGDLERLCIIALGVQTVDPHLVTGPALQIPSAEGRVPLDGVIAQDGGESIPVVVHDIGYQGVFFQVMGEVSFEPGAQLTLSLQTLTPPIQVPIRVSWQGNHDLHQVHGVGGTFLTPQPELARRLGCRRVADSAQSSTHMVLPPHCNGVGTAFGGQLLKWMNEAAGITAGYHIGGPYVTGSVGELFFIRGIHQGEFVTLRSFSTFTGRCSLEVAVEVIRDDPASRIREVCLRGYFTFVSLSQEGHPAPVTPLVPQTAEEEKHFEEGHHRQQLLRYKRRHRR